MQLLSTAFSTLAKWRYNHLARWRDEPVEAQMNIWENLIRRGEQTQLGVRYGFSSIFSIDDFKERLPIFTYETFKPYINGIMRGEERISWDEPISWLAKSSGTTSDRSKFIPISEDSLEENHYNACKELLTHYYYAYPDAQILNGKILVLGGSHQISTLNKHIQYGDLSAVLMQNEPWMSRYLRVPKLPIALMDEWERKIDALAESTMNEHITTLAGVPTWSLVLLRKILHLKKARYIKEVWPHLELYLHGGVNFLPYKKNFETLMGAPIRYIDIYNASEGFFAFQDTTAAAGMLLLLNHGIFYEFVPLALANDPQAPTLLIDEVSLDTKYALVISTVGGLWRYLVGDVIVFTSLNPYRIKIVGRTQQFINAFGEEVIVANTDKAITQACAQTGALLSDYTVAPIYFNLTDGQAAHEWLIEFEKTPSDITAFTHYLDTALKAANTDYEAKRYKDIALRAPIIHLLPRGGFELWLKQKGRIGGQHKVPRLSNDRKYIDEIKQYFSIN